MERRRPSRGHRHRAAQPEARVAGVVRPARRHTPGAPVRARPASAGSKVPASGGNTLDRTVPGQAMRPGRRTPSRGRSHIPGGPTTDRRGVMGMRTVAQRHTTPFATGKAAPADLQDSPFAVREAVRWQPIPSEIARVAVSCRGHRRSICRRTVCVRRRTARVR